MQVAGSGLLLIMAKRGKNYLEIYDSGSSTTPKKWSKNSVENRIGLGLGLGLGSGLGLGLGLGLDSSL
jgi:hypothetical protein